MTETLNGTVSKILFNNHDSGYTILKIETKSGIITATGSLPNIQAGQELMFVGKWIIHPKFGKQFNIESAITTTPKSKAGLIKFLGSGLIKGIGEAFAVTLVEYLGLEALDIIENDPKRLEQVPGIGPKRALSICESLKENKAISSLMIFLQEKGVGTGLATKIYKNYKHESMAIIQQNPYRLVEDLWGVGFKTADTLAQKMGTKNDDLARIKAGISHLITETLAQGSLYIEAEQLKLNTRVLLELELEHNDKIRLALQEMHTSGILKFLTEDSKHYLTLTKYLIIEQNIAEIIKSNNKTEACDTTDIYNQLRTSSLNVEQQNGIIAAFCNTFSIITGGPGTGKTTLVRELIKIFEKSNSTYLLAAPTGRAAKRLIESTGRFASTIHRLLDFDVGSMSFKSNQKNPLKADFLIIDEASMIDVFLMNAILKALNKSTHLILIGDIDQLPSVGPGNILNDLIESGIVATTKLNFIFRQTQGSMITINAHKINKGDFIEQGHDFIFIKEENPELIVDHLEKLYKYTFATKNIKNINTIILTPMNRASAGTQVLNNICQKLLNPHETTGILVKGVTLKKNDRVMQITNNYDKNIFNGDLGSIINISTEIVEIMFGDKIVQYENFELDQLVLAYATTVHKSQGSEFDAVIIPIFTQHYTLLQRNLLYTAITRAKKLCVLIGQTKAIAMAIANNKNFKRITFLKSMLKS